MSTSAQRAALEAMHSARPLVARLDASRSGEDLAADLIESWTAVETGLRSLIGGSALSGQMLIRELRQRHFLSLEQANALAEFHASRERASRTDYQPTESDINAARDAFLKLESGLMSAAPVSTFAPGGAAVASAGGATLAASAARSATVPMDTVQERAASVPRATATAVPISGGGRPGWLIPLLGALALVLVGGIAWFALASRGGRGAYDEGVRAYGEGRREAAAGAFIKATRDTPDDPMPHVYLARMAREAGRLQTAQEEAVKAVSLGPSNAIALRELASVSFAQQNYDSARRFYLRALGVDAKDALSQGYLGCSLIRLGRVAEGVKFIQRAGSGSWTGCVPAPGAAPGTPGMMPQAAQQYPPGYQPAPLSP
ncbi:MAG: tetratricopeptide repeat protein [Gemmatimonadaceae bacterium]|nr:tetratricopeptide repeat protein [Gemmatimonadaceae bacterium]